MFWRDIASCLAGYLLIAFALAFAMDYVAPPFGTGLYVSEQPISISEPDPAIVVDRLRKSDRFVAAPIEANNTVLPEIPARVGARDI